MIRSTALFLTVLTGFSGLVYEVTWQKYLAALLGSHSEATAAVLGLFLGGLSLGYWLFGAVTRRVVTRAQERGVPPRLLFVYGSLEAGIGVFVVLFPWLYRGVQALSYAIPHGAGGVGFAIDVGLAALLIGPPSVLMGGTIPMLTQALSRSLDDATRFHAFVYAFNTAGAFVGALAAGFWLIPQLGLINVMYAMGAINLAAGSLFMVLGYRGRAVVDLSSGDVGEESPAIEGFHWYAAVALLTGFAMMAVQTGIIRVAGASFGSSQFTFSMVVAVFVLCIALGSFAVSALSRIPTWLIVANQWALALFLLILYVELPEAPYWVHALRTLFRPVDPAFYFYYGMGFVLVLIAIGIPVIMSGAALPLLFHHLRRQVGHLGDLAGSLYSWNTVGSLLGALLGGYLLLFWLDLHHVYKLAIAAVFVSAAMLTVMAYSLPRVIALGVLPIVGALVLMPGWAPEKLTAGLFRLREERVGSYEGARAFEQKNPGIYQRSILFYDDDPTATIAVRQSQAKDGRMSLTLLTNGKSDGNTVLDYATGGLVATVPAMMADDPKRAFVVGWGTGISVGELASFDAVREIVVAEISPGIVESASLFDEANLDASRSPKVTLLASDAYRALMRSEETYDLIISQPSNPWVTGVEMLFSREFLTAAREKLSGGGVYCHWYQMYETDDESVALVLRTYAEVFDHVAVWAVTSGDLMFFGFKSSGPALDHFRLADRARQPDFSAALERSGVDGFAALLAHEVLPLGVAHALEDEGPIHTLYHPILSDTAGRAFFRGGRGAVPFTGFGLPAEVGAANSMLGAYSRLFSDGLPDDQRAALVYETCKIQGTRCRTVLAQWLIDDPASPALAEVMADVVARTKMTSTVDIEQLVPLLPGGRRPAGHTNPDDAARASADFVAAYLHGIPFSGDRLVDYWNGCREGAVDPHTCVEVVSRRILVDPDVDGEALMAECLGQGRVGRACEKGLSSAQLLVEDGVVVEAAPKH